MRSGKDFRLSRKNDFEDIFKNGDRISGETLTVYYIRGKESRKFACLVSGKVGKTVIRNRIKRALREEYRLNLQRIPDDLWLIVRMRYKETKLKNITRRSLKELRENFKEMLDEITGPSGHGSFNGILYTIFTSPIKLYTLLISPILPPSCRFTPTCSEYALQAISIYGPLKGTGKALYRIMRCNPWNKGGFDPP